MHFLLERDDSSVSHLIVSEVWIRITEPMVGWFDFFGGLLYLVGKIKVEFFSFYGLLACTSSCQCKHPCFIDFLAYLGGGFPRFFECLPQTLGGSWSNLTWAYFFRWVVALDTTVDGSYIRRSPPVDCWRFPMKKIKIIHVNLVVAGFLNHQQQVVILDRSLRFWKLYFNGKYVLIVSTTW